MRSVPVSSINILPALIEHCLHDGGGKRVRTGFPTLLEERYQQEMAADRRRTLTVASGAGIAAAIALFPALRTTLPGAEHFAGRLWLTLVLPAALLNFSLLQLPVRTIWYEIGTVASTLVVAASLSILFLVAHHPMCAAYPPGMSMLFVFVALGAQVPFLAATACGVGILLMMFETCFRLPWGEPAVAEPVFLVTLTTVVFVLLATRRLEVERRRGFLLTLRETLRGETLSAENIELQELARRDALTGLPNRRAFDCWMNTLLASGTRSSPISLISIDIDHFKSYNDRYGHPAGDGCLQTVARCLRDQLRDTSDMVARLGGEEFVAVLPGLMLDEAVEVAERLRTAVDRLELPHAGIARGRGIVTISAGVATAQAGAQTSLGALLDAADAALYAAKETGRNRVCLSA